MLQRDAIKRDIFIIADITLMAIFDFHASDTLIIGFERYVADIFTISCGVFDDAILR
jgi:hypothetical protein